MKELRAPTQHVSRRRLLGSAASRIPWLDRFAEHDLKQLVTEKERVTAPAKALPNNSPLSREDAPLDLATKGPNPLKQKHLRSPHF